MLLVVSSLVATATGVRAATVSGRVVGPSVVWISDESDVRPIVTEMRNTGKSFVPSLLAVPVGSTVRFPNDDPFFHSIFSASEPDPFDIGFYPAGPGKDVAFPRVGVLEVRCHIHALMHANIVVVDGPYALAESTFAVGNVGPGERAVHAWSLEKGLRTTTVRVPDGDGSVTVSRGL